MRKPPLEVSVSSPNPSFHFLILRFSRISSNSIFHDRFLSCGWEVGTTIVSQVLGQMKMDSAKQYLSFNTENLRECAISLDGIEIDGGVFGD